MLNTTHYLLTSIIFFIFNIIFIITDLLTTTFVCSCCRRRCWRCLLGYLLLLFFIFGCVLLDTFLLSLLKHTFLNTHHTVITTFTRYFLRFFLLFTSFPPPPFASFSHILSYFIWPVKHDDDESFLLQSKIYTFLTYQASAKADF